MVQNHYIYGLLVLLSGLINILLSDQHQIVILTRACGTVVRRGPPAAIVCAAPLLLSPMSQFTLHKIIAPLNATVDARGDCAHARFCCSDSLFKLLELGRALRLLCVLCVLALGLQVSSALQLYIPSKSCGYFAIPFSQFELGRTRAATPAARCRDVRRRALLAIHSHIALVCCKTKSHRPI